jgi:hypothetical protein
MASSDIPMCRRAICLWSVALAVWVSSAAVAAHDLPTNVLVQIFIKPEGDRVRLVVRVPAAAMGDVDYPTRGPAGLVDLARVDRALEDAATLWLIPAIRLFEEDRPVGPPRLVAARMSLPSDRSFSAYDDAVRHVTGPALSPDVELFWNQALLDAVLEYDVGSDQSTFAIDPALARLGVHVVTALRFLPPGGAVRAFEFRGDPGTIRLDPRWHQSALRFVQLGFTHILEGADHLLFLVCLVIPLRRLRALVPVVTAFAVAHSITLIASAFDVTPGALWFPPLIEMLIALSIVYMAIENMLAARFDHRWVVAFGFGLVHGFGFSFALRESLQFAGSHLLVSLLSFNIGVELGQVLVVGLLIPPLNFLFRHARSERVGSIVLSALVAHSAWHWMIERGQALRQFTFEWPTADAAFAARLAGWLLVAAIAGGALWLFSVLASRAGHRQAASLTRDSSRPLPRGPGSI